MGVTPSPEAAILLPFAWERSRAAAEPVGAPWDHLRIQNSPGPRGHGGIKEGL